MDRERILRRIVGPHPFGNTTMRWRFTARRQLRHVRPGHGTTQGRAYELQFDPKTRQFEVKCYRYLSKKRKRVAVTTSKAMVAYLKSRLLPQHIARCMAASILPQSKPTLDMAINPTGWVNNFGATNFKPPSAPVSPPPYQTRVIKALTGGGP